VNKSFLILLAVLCIAADRKETLNGSNYRLVTLSPGISQTISATGNAFKVIAAGVPVAIRPEGGSFSSYSQGQGLTTGEFSTLDVLLPVTKANALITGANINVIVWVGFDTLLDGRQYSEGAQLIPVPNATSGFADFILPDKSGQIYTPSTAIVTNSPPTFNGQYISWLLQRRKYLIVGNDSTADPLTVAVYPGGGLVYTIPKATAAGAWQYATIECGGDLELNGDASNPSSVCEFYWASPVPTPTGAQ
jgi:hypothetical protein